MADVNTNVNINVKMESDNSSNFSNTINNTVDGVTELKNKLEEVGISLDSLSASIKNNEESASSSISYFDNVSESLLALKDRANSLNNTDFNKLTSKYEAVNATVNTIKNNYNEYIDLFSKVIAAQVNGEDVTDDLMSNFEKVSKDMKDILKDGPQVFKSLQTEIDSANESLDETVDLNKFLREMSSFGDIDVHLNSKEVEEESNKIQTSVTKVVTKLDSAGKKRNYFNGVITNMDELGEVAVGAEVEIDGMIATITELSQTKDSFGDIVTNFRAIQGSSREVNEELSNSSECWDTAKAKAVEFAGVALDKIIDLAEKAVEKIVELGKNVIDLGKSFEYAEAKVNTLTSGTFKEYNDVQKEAASIATKYGKDIVDVTESIYDALSSGISENNVFNFIDSSSKLATAGFTDVQTASEGLISVLNAYGGEIKGLNGDMLDLNELANRFVITQDLGRAEVGDLTENIGKVAPSASLVGVSVDEMLASVASISAVTGNAADTMTQLNAILTSVSTASDKTKKAAKEMGIDFSSSAIQAKGLYNWLAEVAEKTGGNDELIAELFPDVREFKGFAALTTQTSRDIYNDYIEAIESGSSKIDENLKVVTDTFDYRLNELKASIDNISILSFDNIKDSLKDFVGSVDIEFNSLHDKLANTELGDSFYASINELIVFVKELVSALISDLPDIIPIITNITNAFKNVLDNIKNLVDFLSPVLLPILNFLSRVLSENSEGLFVLITSLTIFNKTSSVTNNIVSNFTKFIKEATKSGSKLNTQILKICPLFNELTSGATTAGAAIKSMLNVELTGAAAAGGIAVVIFLVAELVSTLVDLGKEAAEVQASILTGPDYAKQAEDFKNALDSEKESLDNLLESQEKINDADNANIDNLQRLWNELENYVDSNGNVIDCNERAVAIIDLLNNNYGLNIDYQNGMIMGYKNLAGSMDNYIEKLREEALIRNMQPVYDEAVSMKYNYEKQKRDLESDIKLTEASLLASAKKFREAARGSLEEETAMNVMDTFQAELDMQKAELEALDEGIANAESTMNEFEDLFKKHTDNIENIVEDSTEAIVDFLSLEKVKQINSDYLTQLKREQEDYVTYTKRLNDDEKESLKRANKQALEDIKKIYEEKKKLSKQSLEDAKREADDDYNRFKNAQDEAKAKREMDKLNKQIQDKKKEIAKYGDYNLLVTSDDRKAYKSLEDELEKLIEDKNEKELESEEERALKEMEILRDAAKERAEAEYNAKAESLDNEKEAALATQESINDAALKSLERSIEDSQTMLKRAQEDFMNSEKARLSEIEDAVKDGASYMVDETTGALVQIDTALLNTKSNADSLSDSFNNIADSASTASEKIADIGDKVKGLETEFNFDTKVADVMRDYVDFITGNTDMNPAEKEAFNTSSKLLTSNKTSWGAYKSDVKNENVSVTNNYYTPVVDETVRSKTRSNMFNSGLDSSIYN